MTPPNLCSVFVVIVASCMYCALPSLFTLSGVNAAVNHLEGQVKNSQDGVTVTPSTAEMLPHQPRSRSARRGPAKMVRWLIVRTDKGNQRTRIEDSYVLPVLTWTVGDDDAVSKQRNIPRGRVPQQIQQANDRTARQQQPAGDSSTVCENDQWVAFNRTCYLPVSTAMTWNEASRHCRTVIPNRSTLLVAIESQEENDFLVGLTKGRSSPEEGGWWIGAHVGHFVFRSDGHNFTHVWDMGHWNEVKTKPMEFTKLKIDNPQRPGWCLQLTGEDWRDSDCDVKMPFICEYASKSAKSQDGDDSSQSIGE